MIEMVSAFGPLGIVAYAETTNDRSRRDVSGHSATSPDRSGRDVTSYEHEKDRAEGLIGFLAECTEPTQSSSGIGVDKLFAAYRAWCKQANVPARDATEFVREFDKLRELPELQGTIKKFGSRYFGIALAATMGAANARA
jgi:hypothetical protein